MSGRVWEVRHRTIWPFRTFLVKDDVPYAETFEFDQAKELAQRLNDSASDHETIAELRLAIKHLAAALKNLAMATPDRVTREVALRAARVAEEKIRTAPNGSGPTTEET